MCTKETKINPERYLFKTCFTISRLFSSHDGVVNSLIFILLKAKLLLLSHRIVFHSPTRPSIRIIYRAFHINNGHNNHIFQGDGYLHVSTCSMVSPSCHSLPSSLLFGLGGGLRGPMMGISMTWPFGTLAGAKSRKNGVTGHSYPRNLQGLGIKLSRKF